MSTKSFSATMNKTSFDKKVEIHSNPPKSKVPLIAKQLDEQQQSGAAIQPNIPGRDIKHFERSVEDGTIQPQTDKSSILADTKSGSPIQKHSSNDTFPDALTTGFASSKRSPNPPSRHVSVLTTELSQITTAGFSSSQNTEPLLQTRNASSNWKKAFAGINLSKTLSAPSTPNTSLDQLDSNRKTVHFSLYNTTSSSKGSILDRVSEKEEDANFQTSHVSKNVGTKESIDSGSITKLRRNSSDVNTSSSFLKDQSYGIAANSYKHQLPQSNPTLVNSISFPSVEKSIRPEISKLPRNLEQTIKANPLHVAVVFFHQCNGDENDTVDMYTAHHDAKWNDPTFVRSALSSKYDVICAQGRVKKWDIINHSLLHLVTQCKPTGSQQPVDLLMQTAISSYDVSIQSKTDFMILHHPDIAQCITTTIPVIVQHALRLPSLLAEPIPILKAHQNKTIYLTKKLVCSLLANAFFCTLPDERGNLPDINFHSLFNTAARGDAKAEKLKCILNYFQAVGNPGKNEEKENRIISFERRCIRKKVDWANSTRRLTNMSVELSKKIEEAHGSLQVDFANKKVGGGVLNEGAVMEEILFAVCPELIISRLFTEILEDDEVLVITGTQQYSKYQGYSRNFHFGGEFTPLDYQVDQLGRNCSQVVVMDALHFKQYEVDSQFQENCINRELHKAYVGFFIPEGEPNIPIATGNWGCGAFNGDLELKFLIQWMAASVAGRSLMIYHTIGDRKLSQAIQSMQSFLMQRNVSVGQLYKKVITYHRKMAKYPSLFQYIENAFSI